MYEGDHVCARVSKWTRGASNALPPLDGEGRGGVDYETRSVRAESPPPPQPSPIKGEGFGASQTQAER
jgi:hypothetical protein